MKRRHRKFCCPPLARDKGGTVTKRLGKLLTGIQRTCTGSNGY